MPPIQDQFTFDHVFTEDSTTREIFQKQILDQIKQAIEGYNITVFAYGQTSSGKTYTMKGDLRNPGIIGLSVKALFQLLKKWKKHSEGEASFTVKVSYLEVYNE